MRKKFLTHQFTLEEMNAISLEGVPKKHQCRALCSSEISAISEYLQNPTHAGVWRLSFTLSPEAKFCATVLSNLEKKLKGKSTVVIASGQRKMNLRLTSEVKMLWRNAIKQGSFLVERVRTC